MNQKKYDIAIIGAGPGGYVAAIKLTQGGKKVCLIEKQFLGGTCLNVGCIPTKTLLSDANLSHKVTANAEKLGLKKDAICPNYPKIKQDKDRVVEKIRKGLQGLLQSNQITILYGQAEFISPKELKITGKEVCRIEAEQIIIATGSEPLDIPSLPCDHQLVYNSTSILELTELPKTLVIVGGGYIGCEFASLFTDLKVKVTILEALPSIVTNQGKSVSEALTRAFYKKGIEIQTNVTVIGIDKQESGLRIRLEGGKELFCDKALIAIGRKLVSNGLGLEKIGVVLDQKGAIVVNEKMQTNLDGIYAIGDVTGKNLLAHVASHQGIIAADTILGKAVEMYYNAIPAVIFTNPEIAMVGMTFEEAEKAGFSPIIGNFPFQALGKAIASAETDGFAQIIVDKSTDQILGAQVVGSEASTLIAEMSLAIAQELTLDCIIDTIHAHPTLPEAWHEAALLANETPLHFPPKRKS
ncbi:dihydrolipoyl dehydrogenase [Candidatus Rhabdochlamydia porcellionis]|uniref:Dihydrolipoyl dehydrogenase n=1 Tax=Candidatus Rhabdochlamydia porcellionis TaxID=225148 RepID=A0ABX8Z4Y7_9BACT|nr:dihydrolipoyl dehydrogenase [Candidatus Rhabdochlamydia porcellionis]QZA59373.1 Dihydrolipoyl dehydrogenase [Candidatus Rhabdochlamydia porcellionis]